MSDGPARRADGPEAKEAACLVVGSDRFDGFLDDWDTERGHVQAHLPRPGVSPTSRGRSLWAIRRPRLCGVAGSGRLQETPPEDENLHQIVSSPTGLVGEEHVEFRACVHERLTMGGRIDS